MRRTYSVKDGGRLCVCGRLKCQHKDGVGVGIGSRNLPSSASREGPYCTKFVDRAPETAEAS